MKVFRLVSGHVTWEGMKLILEVLEPKTSKEELMEEEEEGEGEGSEEEGEGESEEEGGGEGGDGSEGDDGDSVASEESEGGEEGGEVDPMFRAEVQKALGAAAVDSEAEVSQCSTVHVCCSNLCTGSAVSREVEIMNMYSIVCTMSAIYMHIYMYMCYFACTCEY